MPKIDWRTVDQTPKTYEFNYDWKDVVLYALGIGAQNDELSYIYENAPGGLKVFPGFAAIACGGLIIEMAKGLEGNQFLHGEQMIRLHQSIPPQGKIISTGRVAHIFDKGKSAVIVFEFQGRTDEGVLLFDLEHIAFHVGGGGFGGDPGTKTSVLIPPEGQKPAIQVSFPIPENQAALYRLNKDFNPLHIDPDYARAGGFSKPILHGLCTYGYATRAIINSLCQGDVTRFQEFKARFSGVVYPGETLTTEAWPDKEGHYIIQARTERAIVISNAYALVKKCAVSA